MYSSIPCSGSEPARLEEPPHIKMKSRMNSFISQAKRMRWLAAVASLTAGQQSFSQAALPSQAAVELVYLSLACSASGGGQPKIKGIRVERLSGTQGDLPYLLVTNEISKATVRIYFEPALEAAAGERASCFGGALALVESALPAPGAPITWAPLVLTRDEHYVPPHRDGERRWIVPHFAGHWDEEAMGFLLRVMPHEETHQLQGTIRPELLPRWFEEGHAEWVGLKVTEQVRPDLANNRRAQLAEAQAALKDPHLANWGGMKVKPEAILRQLSPADRERLKSDPTFKPQGPFQFGPGDFVEDNTNVEGRYGASLAIFDSLERRHGTAAVQNWISSVLKEPDNRRIVPLARELLDEDLAPVLR